MKLDFTNEELQHLDNLIKATPFQYAYPIFEFFKNKIAQAQKAEASITQDSLQPAETN